MDLSGGGSVYQGLLGHAYAQAGKRAEAIRVLEGLKQRSKQHYVSPYDFAIIYLGLGEKDKTFAWFEQAYQERSSWMPWLQVDPLYDPLRSDPRFKDLLRRMGLTP